MRSRMILEKERKRKARRARSQKSLARAKRVQVVVYRSARHIYAQLVDPESGRTIAGVSSRNREICEGATAGNVEAAKKVGTAIAEKAKAANVERVVFNRNGFLYHGRVKALADAAREAGLDF